MRKVERRLVGVLSAGLLLCANRVLPEFEEWTDAVMEQFDRDKNSGKDVLRWYIDLLPSAIQAAPVQYQRYKFARDWAEFDAANREPDWTNTAHGYAIYLIYRFGETKPEKAIDAYRAAVNVFGEEHVHTMAERIRPAFNKRQSTVDLKSLGLIQYRTCLNDKGVPISCDDPVPPDLTWMGMSRLDNVFMTLLAAGDIRHYVMGLQFKRHQRSARTHQQEFWNWEIPEYSYRCWLTYMGRRQSMMPERR